VARYKGHFPDHFRVDGRNSNTGCEAQDLAVAPKDRCEIGLAEYSGRLDKRIEHRRQIEGRAADRLQNLRRGRLLPQRFVELVRARLDFPVEAAEFL
jgi:hypothetical protein